MVTTLVDGNRGLVDDIADEKWASEQREGVEQLVHLSPACQRGARATLSGRGAHHRVGDIGMRCPDVTLREQRADVRAPGVARPPEDLLEETPVGLHRREQLRLLAALDVGTPAVTDHPSSQEFVVTGVELVFP